MLHQRWMPTHLEWEKLISCSFVQKSLLLRKSKIFYYFLQKEIIIYFLCFLPVTSFLFEKFGRLLNTVEISLMQNTELWQRLKHPCFKCKTIKQPLLHAAFSGISHESWLNGCLSSITLVATLKKIIIILYWIKIRKMGYCNLENYGKLEKVVVGPNSKAKHMWCPF